MSERFSPLSLGHRLSAEGRFVESAAQFKLAADETDDVGAKKTCKALERKALDLDRARQRQQAPPSAPHAASSSSAGSGPTPISSPPPLSSSAHRHRSRPGRPERRREQLGNEPAPPFALVPSSAAAGSSATVGLSSPPPSTSTHATMRASTSLVRQAAERARNQRHLDRSRLDEGPSHVRDSGSGWAGSGSWTGGGPGESSSYLSTRDRADPFSRFWAVVEGMLGDYSSPVAFASAPIGSVLDGRTGRGAAAAPGPTVASALRRSVTTPANLEQRGDRRADPHDSFLLVSPQASSAASSFGSLDDFPASTKTLEELQLENLSLRLSLDTLASHAHALERRLADAASSSSTTARSSPAPAVRSLPPAREGPTSVPSERRTLSLTPGRPRTDKLVTVSAAAASVVDLSRLRQEVEKVWRGEESRVLEMSRAVQAAQQAVTNNEPGKRSSSTSDPEKRIDELERQLAELRDENASQKETIARFKDRFERIKSSARRRRDEERVREDAESVTIGGLPAAEEAAKASRAASNDG